jgi:hypothetical protein
MTGEEFLALPKETKQDFVASTLTQKKDSPEGKLYFIPKTACCRNYVEWGWGQAPKVCPYCGSVHWQKPALEYFLFTEQDKFVQEYPDTTRLGKKMFPLILDYAKNLIQGLIKGNTTLNSDDLDEKANDAATMLLEVILKDPNHSMKWSFGEYLKRLCKSVTFGPKDHEQTFSLNSILGDGERELGDTIVVKAHTGGIDVAAGNDEDVEEFRMNNSYESEYKEQENLPTKMISIVEKSADAIWSNTQKQEDCILFLLGMILKFKTKDEKALLDFYTMAGTQTKKFVEKGELVLYSYLKSITQ